MPKAVLPYPRRGAAASCDPPPPRGRLPAMSAPAALVLDLTDLAATEALAARVARAARPGDAILLAGPLGAGKSAFARAFLRAAAADPTLEVPSPSYTLVQTYDLPPFRAHHFDLWRLAGAADLAELDWAEARADVVLVEWPDRLGRLYPADALTIDLQLTGAETRRATLSGWGERMEALA
jgi:tRNA threonylcarbamoyladenosine biosynthesis protein TsaE